MWYVCTSKYKFCSRFQSAFKEVNVKVIIPSQTKANNCPHCSALPAPLENPPLVIPTQTVGTDGQYVLDYVVSGVELLNDLSAADAVRLGVSDAELSTTESDNLSTNSDPEADVNSSAKQEPTPFNPAAQRHVGFADPLIKSSTFTRKGKIVSLKRKPDAEDNGSDSEIVGKRGKFIH